jgi:hypothetical protein
MTLINIIFLVFVFNLLLILPLLTDIHILTCRSIRTSCLCCPLHYLQSCLIITYSLRILLQCLRSFAWNAVFLDAIHSLICAPSLCSVGCDYGESGGCLNTICPFSAELWSVSHNICALACLIWLYCQDLGGVTIDGVWIEYWIYWHHSELHVITALWSTHFTAQHYTSTMVLNLH